MVDVSNEQIGVISGFKHTVECRSLQEEADARNCVPILYVPIMPDRYHYARMTMKMKKRKKEHRCGFDALYCKSLNIYKIVIEDNH